MAKLKGLSCRWMRKMKFLVKAYITHIVHSDQFCETTGITSKNGWFFIFYFIVLSWAVADTAEVILLKALILQVIGLYQKVVPHLVNQCKFDFSKLLKGNTFFHSVHIWIMCFGYEAGGLKQILELLMCFLIVQGLCQRKECGKKSPLFCSFKYCSWP